MKMILKNKNAFIFILTAVLLCGVSGCAEIEGNGSISENLTYIGVSPTTDETVDAMDKDSFTKLERPYKIDEPLWGIMEKAEDDELIPVSIWISDIDFEEVEKKIEEKGVQFDMSDIDDVQAYIGEQRKIAKEMFIESNGKFVEDYLSGAEDVYAFEYFPIIDCSITKEKILYLVYIDSVESISSNSDKDAALI